MSKINIKTLTSVHIGSGNTFQNKTDFVLGQDQEGNNVISIINPDKVLNLIGQEKYHIDTWVMGIEKGRSTKDVVSQFAPNAKLEDFSERILTNWATIKDSDSLKEFLHDGLGRPYIPGSSIKGAIRTALLASVAGKLQDNEKPIKNSRGEISASTIEKKLFGSDPNKDVFRFLQVGDAIFSREDEMIAIRMFNINERDKNSFWDTSKSQVIEVLSNDVTATFNMKINHNAYNNAYGNVCDMPLCMRNLNSLFQTINRHTIQLLEEEIDYWKERENAPNAGEEVGDYLKRIQEMLDEAKSSAPNSCVIRIGHGSGWRFITGAWTESLDEFHQVIVPKARPGNFKYEQFDFPKTRRVDDACELLGFVRLTLVE